MLSESLTHPEVLAFDGEPPPKPSISPLRQTLRFFSDPFSLVQEAQDECGDVFMLHILGLGRWVMVASAELLQQLYRIPEDQLEAGSIRGKMLGRLVGEKASICIDGREYARRRKLTAPLFNGARLYRHTGTLERLTEQCLATWPRDRAFSAQRHLDRIAIAIACRVLYGAGERPTLRRLIDLSEGYLMAMKSPGVQIQPLRLNLGTWSPWGRFLALQRDYFQALEDEIDARLRGEAGGDEDLVSVLIEAYDPTDPGEREIVVHELASFLLGGAESTSKPIAWALYGLLQRPDALAQLRSELDDVLADRPVEAADLKRLPYLHAVVQEGIRYGRAAVFAGPRWTRTPVRLGRYLLPEGVIVGQCYGRTTRGSVFHQLDTFAPENFLEHRVKMSDWLPFGGGSRICTGMGLAQLEMAIVIASIVRRFELSLESPGTRPKPDGIFFTPPGGLCLRIHDRQTTDLRE